MRPPAVAAGRDFGHTVGMISSVKGTVQDVRPGLLTLLVGPIGLDIQVPASMSATVRHGETLSIATHTYVTDDAISLYGFANDRDRLLFRQLLTVSGVGPKSALGILAAGPDEVRTALVTKDVKTLSSLPGIGPKRAQRLILELANVLTEIEETPKKGKKKATPEYEAVEAALERLGYKKEEIRRMTADLPEGMTPEAALSYILKNAR